MQDVSMLQNRLCTLVLFRALLQDGAVSAFLRVRRQAEVGAEDAAARAGEFIAALYKTGDNLSDYIADLVFEDENAYIRRAAEGRLTENYERTLQTELAVLQDFCDLTAEAFQTFTGLSIPLPVWQNTPIDLRTVYTQRIKNIAKIGYGMFAKYHMFSLKDGKIAPVRHPDNQRLTDFSGYELERSRIIANTKALLSGCPCNNVLLYGDAGAGKSSTVKAIVNEYKDEGLRLIEVKKNELFYLPDILDSLAKNPLKFIIFIDDLSFAADDSDFGALKAILEGSVSGRSRNIAIYATSNRRHLVKERLSDREGDDLHMQDTIQELTSLSARFGLKVTFSKPDKKLYESIVRDLAKQYHIEMPEDELFLKAEAHALRSGGRSPRTAKQFIEYLAYTASHEG